MLDRATILPHSANGLLEEIYDLTLFQIDIQWRDEVAAALASSVLNALASEQCQLASDAERAVVIPRSTSKLWLFGSELNHAQILRAMHGEMKGRWFALSDITAQFALLRMKGCIARAILPSAISLDVSSLRPGVGYITKFVEMLAIIRFSRTHDVCQLFVSREFAMFAADWIYDAAQVCDLDQALVSGDGESARDH